MSTDPTLIREVLTEVEHEPNRAALHNDLAEVILRHYGHVRLSVRMAAAAAAETVVDEQRRAHATWLRAQLATADREQNGDERARQALGEEETT